jgi:uncharacterized protein
MKGEEADIAFGCKTLDRFLLTLHEVSVNKLKDVINRRVGWHAQVSHAAGVHLFNERPRFFAEGGFPPDRRLSAGGAHKPVAGRRWAASEQETTMSKRDAVGVWFELPAIDFDRACSFYEDLLDVTLKREDMGPMKMGVFPYLGGPDSSSGCIWFGPMAAKPSMEGTTVYLNCDGNLEAVVARVPVAGGTMLTPIIDLPEGFGRFALISDSEGNRVGLHAVR